MVMIYSKLVIHSVNTWLAIDSTRVDGPTLSTSLAYPTKESMQNNNIDVMR